MFIRAWFLQVYEHLIKLSVKANLGISLKFFVFANLESVGCEVYFPEKKF